MRFRFVFLGLVSLILAVAACVSPSSLTEDQAATETSSPVFQPLPSLTPLPDIPIVSSPTRFTEGDLSALYERVNPGVVTIITYSDLTPLADENIPSGQGSGFVIDFDGHIVTNQHVIDGASEIEVDFPSGFKTWASVAGSDPDSDLAVLNVSAPTGILFPLTLGDSDQLHVGEFVVAIGNPFGLNGTMTVGIVSAKGRTLASENPSPGGAYFSAGDIIQTDAAINPGNSGGPLINMRGEVIGVNRAIRTEAFTVTGDAANSGVGFAIPVNIVRRVLPAIIAEGKYDYPYLGISSLSDWNLKTVEALELPNDVLGAYVTCVTPRSPAARAGLIGAGDCADAGLRRGGDLIIAIDHQPVYQFSDLLSYLINHTQVDQVVTFTVLRDGEEIDLSLTIGARP
jgi:2-alkenal reductase